MMDSNDIGRIGRDRTIGVVLEVAVGLLVGQAIIIIIINRLTGVRYPFWANVRTPEIGALASRGALQRFTRHSVD